MKLNFWRKDNQPPVAFKAAQWEDTLRRLILSQEGNLGSMVSPQNCMQSPTVHAIVTAVSRRMSVTPVHVYQKTTTNGRDSKEPLPNHSVARLLKMPNKWQCSQDFFGDAASAYLRFGNFYAYKSRAAAGPIRELLPLNPAEVIPEQDEKTWDVTYRIDGEMVSPDRIFHARGPARNFLEGDSPVNDVSTAIALEILSERFGANFFKNGAIPLLIFSFLEGSAGFQTVEQEKAFLQQLKETLGGSKQLSSMLLPKGMAPPNGVNIKHDEAQFLETRKLQRTIIAGAFGVPPHLVGSLEDAHYNNVEQQDKDFTQNVILPVARAFESAMERDLLTPADRNSGICIRFNLDSVMRASFKDRQEGLQIQRSNGIISANEWREIEGLNPRDDEEGDDYLHPGNMVVDGEEPNDPEPDSQFTNQEPE